jgi:hypothetical protein
MSETSSGEEYQQWKAQIRNEIEANEGHDNPTAEELWHRAGVEARTAAGWVDDVPLSMSEIKMAKGDLLTALVALEMAEDRLESENGN